MTRRQFTYYANGRIVDSKTDIPIAKPGSAPLPPEMNPQRWIDKKHKPPFWIAHAPDCPKCKAARAPIVHLWQGFFGLDYAYAPFCLDCIAAVLGEGAAKATAQSMRDICDGSVMRRKAPKKRISILPAPDGKEA